MHDILAKLQARRPLVHCLTNPVAAALTANALLCVGASPLMAEAEAEMRDVAGFAAALLVNLGMQTPARTQSAIAAVACARQRDLPWVLDPVAAGSIPERLELARGFAAAGPRVIKGNASEIIALAGGGTGGLGTDATDTLARAQDPARRMAAATGAVVAVTGATDWLTDGSSEAAIEGGHPLMAQVSGLGCVAGAMIAAFLAVEPNALHAATGALRLLARAGERAASNAHGPGTFVAALLDALANEAAATGRGPARE